MQKERQETKKYRVELLPTKPVYVVRNEKGEICNGAEFHKKHLAERYCNLLNSLYSDSQ